MKQRISRGNERCCFPWFLLIGSKFDLIQKVFDLFLKTAMEFEKDLISIESANVSQDTDSSFSHSFFGHVIGRLVGFV